MEEYLSAFILAFIQAATEFLPISSSGHLQVYKNFSSSLEKFDLTFDIMLHAGTMVATLAYFRLEIFKIIKGVFNQLKGIRSVEGESYGLRYLIMIIIASAPVGFVGIMYKDRLEEIFSQMSWVAVGFFYTSLLLFSILFLKKEGRKNIPDWKFALIVGFFQMVAILPGVSRSGSCLVACLWAGASKKMGVEFTFIISLPAIGGATLLSIKDIVESGSNISWGIAISSFTIALIFGWLFLKLLLVVFSKGKLYYFGIYTFVLGMICLLSLSS